MCNILRCVCFKDSVAGTFWDVFGFKLLYVSLDVVEVNCCCKVALRTLILVIYENFDLG